MYHSPKNGKAAKAKVPIHAYNIRHKIIGEVVAITRMEVHKLIIEQVKKAGAAFEALPDQGGSGFGDFVEAARKRGIVISINVYVEES